MEWRCAWCGKPHDSDDPPCDNCGHHEFEKAVEQVPAAADEPQGSVWVCPECGRQHQKHSPPCSRCGNLELEHRDVSELDDPLEDIGTRWRDVIEPKYVAGYVAVGILVLVLGLGVVGVIDLPGFGAPSIPDAPGEGERTGNLSLDAVEREFVVALNERRQDAGQSPVSQDETLGRMAEYYTNATVAAEYGDGDYPDSDALDRFDHDCSEHPTVIPATNASGESGDRSVLESNDPAVVASALVELVLDDRGTEQYLLTDQGSVGVAVHVAPDDVVYVTVVAC